VKKKTRRQRAGGHLLGLEVEKNLELAVSEDVINNDVPPAVSHRSGSE
jgi:hypothetical protein